MNLTLTNDMTINYLHNGVSVVLDKIIYQHGQISDIVYQRGSGPTPVDYSIEYFTIESLEDNNTITLTKQSSGVATLFYYSTDDGTTWTSHTTSSTPWSINLNTGQKVKFKSNVKSWCYGGNNTRYHHFSSTKNFDIYGNIMSMTWGDDFIGKTAFQDTGSYEGNTSAHCFEHMFDGCTKLINAENLILPGLTIPFAGYGGMFVGCTGLLTPPKLVATYSYQWGYSGMFDQTNITYIICLLTSWASTNALNAFVPSSTNGICYKDPNTTLPRGSTGIPNSWTIVDYTG